MINNNDPTQDTVFFGRDHETQEFLEFFTNLRGFPGGVQFLGMRSSGRTAFLKHLESVYSDRVYLRKLFEDYQDPAYLRICDNIIMAYMELDDVSTPIRFYIRMMDAVKRTIIKKFAPALEQSMPANIKVVLDEKKVKDIAEELASRFVPPVPKELNLVDDFDRWLDSLLAKLPDARFVFLLNDFDELLCMPKQFDIDFLRKMRSLASKGRLCWVMSSRHDILDSNNVLKITADSPIIHIIRKRIYLGRLTPQDEKQIILHECAIRSKTLDDEEIRIIREIAGPWPKLLRRVVQQWLSVQVVGNDLAKRRKAVEEYLLTSSQTAKVCFHSYWGDLTPEEENYLSHQAHLPASNTLPVPDTLLEFGVVDRPEEQGTECVITSSLFKMWIKNNKPYRI